jgi:hypothetical protein
VASITFICGGRVPRTSLSPRDAIEAATASVRRVEMVRVAVMGVSGGVTGVSADTSIKEIGSDTPLCCALP